MTQCPASALPGEKAGPSAALLLPQVGASVSGRDRAVQILLPQHKAQTGLELGARLVSPGMAQTGWSVKICFLSAGFRLERTWSVGTEMQRNKYFTRKGGNVVTILGINNSFNMKELFRSLLSYLGFEFKQSKRVSWFLLLYPQASGPCVSTKVGCIWVAQRIWARRSPLESVFPYE